MAGKVLEIDLRQLYMYRYIIHHQANGGFHPLPSPSPTTPWELKVHIMDCILCYTFEVWYLVTWVMWPSEEFSMQ